MTQKKALKKIGNNTREKLSKLDKGEIIDAFEMLAESIFALF